MKKVSILLPIISRNNMFSDYDTNPDSEFILDQVMAWVERKDNYFNEFPKPCTKVYRHIVTKKTFYSKETTSNPDFPCFPANYNGVVDTDRFPYDTEVTLHIYYQ